VPYGGRCGALPATTHHDEPEGSEHRVRSGRRPRLDGIEATRSITATLPDVRVVILTTYDLDEYVYDALRCGASGFLLKDVPAAHLADAVRIVADGGALLAPTVTPTNDRAFRPGIPGRRNATGCWRH